MITFNDIYEAMRKEKYSDKLQLLPKNFLKEVADYFKEKKEFLNKRVIVFHKGGKSWKKGFNKKRWNKHLRKKRKWG